MCEPNKCYEWAWRSVDQPDVEPMFVPLEQLFASRYWRDEVVAPRLRQREASLPTIALGIIAVGAVGLGALILARSR